MASTSSNPGFFDPTLNSYSNVPEPPGFDILRELLIRQIIGQKQNPYGMSPAGMQNIKGPLFSSGLRPQASLGYMGQGGGSNLPQEQHAKAYDALPWGSYGSPYTGSERANQAENFMGAGGKPTGGFTGQAPWAQQQQSGLGSGTPRTLASLGNPGYNNFLAMNPGSHGSFGTTPNPYGGTNSGYNMELFMSGAGGNPWSAAAGPVSHDGYDAGTRPKPAPAQPRQGWFWDLLNQVGNRGKGRPGMIGPPVMRENPNQSAGGNGSAWQPAPWLKPPQDMRGGGMRPPMPNEGQNPVQSQWPASPYGEWGHAPQPPTRQMPQSPGGGGMPQMPNWQPPSPNRGPKPPIFGQPSMPLPPAPRYR